MNGFVYGIEFCREGVDLYSFQGAAAMSLISLQDAYNLFDRMPEPQVIYCSISSLFCLLPASHGLGGYLPRVESLRRVKKEGILLDFVGSYKSFLGLKFSQN